VLLQEVDEDAVWNLGNDGRYVCMHVLYCTCLKMKYVICTPFNLLPYIDIVVVASFSDSYEGFICRDGSTTTA
jgi:hypothetical protein